MDGISMTKVHLVPTVGIDCTGT